jgi:hypothetical protein
MFIAYRRVRIAVELLFPGKDGIEERQFNRNRRSPIRNEYKKCRIG